MSIYHLKWGYFMSVSTSAALNAGPGLLHRKRLTQSHTQCQLSDYCSNVLIT